MKKEFEETIDKFFNDIAPVIVLLSCCLAAWLYPNVIVRITLVVLGICYVSIMRNVKMCLRTVEAAKKQEPRSEAITSNHGNFITEFMEQTRDEEYEHVAYFDLSGNKLAEGTLLSPYECCITQEDWHNICRRGDKIICVHNHPNSNCAFSASDFSSFLRNDFTKMSIVVAKDYNFILEKKWDWVCYELSYDSAKTYVEKMRNRYGWLSIFSDHLCSVVVNYMTARKYELQFSIEYIHHTSKSASRTILARAAQYH